MHLSSTTATAHLHIRTPSTLFSSVHENRTPGRRVISEEQQRLCGHSTANIHESARGLHDSRSTRIREVLALHQVLTFSSIFHPVFLQSLAYPTTDRHASPQRQSSLVQNLRFVLSVRGSVSSAPVIALAFVTDSFLNCSRFGSRQAAQIAFKSALFPA